MINLTIQGTDRAVQIIDIANKTSSNFNTSEYQNLQYTNYLVKFGEIQTNFSLNSIKLTQNKIVDDVIFLVVFASLFICALYFFKKVKKL